MFNETESETNGVSSTRLFCYESLDNEMNAGYNVRREIGFKGKPYRWANTHLTTLIEAAQSQVIVVRESQSYLAGPS
jgi:hypothetical protein